MNLLMITGDRALASGKCGAFYNTIEDFHQYWGRVDIICPRVRTTNRKPSTTNHFSNVFIHPSPWPLIFQPFWIFREGPRILKIENGKLKIGNWLMTVHDYPPFYNGIGARLLWQKIKVPYVLEIMHVPGYPKAGNFRERIYKWLMKVFIAMDSKKAVAVRVINQKETPEFLMRTGVPKSKLKYIPAFYIDLEVFKPTVSHQVSTIKQYDLVYAARLEKNKGIFNLVEAMRIAKQTKSDIKLLIIGSGPELENIKLKAKRYKIEDNVIFSGWLEGPQDVARAYNSARIFVNPSYNEGGPRVVLEAMACGLPVITTKVGLMHDIIQDGQSGLFTSWEPSEMADKILMLLSDTEMQKKFSFAGLELVKQFEKKQAIRNYADKLQSLI